MDESASSNAGENDRVALYALMVAEELEAAELSDEPREQARHRALAERYREQLRRASEGQEPDDDGSVQCTNKP